MVSFVNKSFEPETKVKFLSKQVYVTQDTDSKAEGLNKQILDMESENSDPILTT